MAARYGAGAGLDAERMLRGDPGYGVRSGPIRAIRRRAIHAWEGRDLCFGDGGDGPRDGAVCLSCGSGLLVVDCIVVCAIARSRPRVCALEPPPV